MKLVKRQLQESMEGKYCIVAVKPDGSRVFYKDGDFVDSAKDCTVFTDHDEAIDLWYDIDKSQFRRVFVPNWSEAMFESVDPEKKCDKCNTPLNDGGTCPKCDDGEEDYSDKEDDNKDLNEAAIAESAFEPIVNRVVEYTEKHKDEYMRSDSLEDYLNDLSEKGVWVIPESAFGFEIEDPDNITEEEAEQFIQLLIERTDLEDRLAEAAGDSELTEQVKDDALVHPVDLFEQEFQKHLANKNFDAAEAMVRDLELGVAEMEELNRKRKIFKYPKFLISMERSIAAKYRNKLTKVKAAAENGERETEEISD